MLGAPVFAGGAAFGGVCLAAALARARSSRPELIYRHTAFHKAVLSRCPTLAEVYKLMPFLFGNGCAASCCVCGCVVHQVTWLSLSAELLSQALGNSAGLAAAQQPSS